MYYSFDLTVPPNTSASSPAELLVDLAPGTIHRVELQFPAGCAGLVHVRIFHASHQVWPSNPDGTISSDGLLVAWTEAWDLRSKPHQLRLLAYNLDDTFYHTIAFRFALAEFTGPGVEPAEAIPLEPVLGFLELP